MVPFCDGLVVAPALFRLVEVELELELETWRIVVQLCDGFVGVPLLIFN